MLFGVPFLIGTVFLVYAILYMLFGRMTLQLRGTDSWLLDGIGSFGWRQSFDAGAAESIRVVETRGRRGSTTKHIELWSDKRRLGKVAGSMTDETTDYLAQYLAHRLLASDRARQLPKSEDDKDDRIRRL